VRQDEGIALNLVFDPIKHEYFLDGLKVPGITTVLSDMGFDDVDKWAKPEHRDRGTAVHELCSEIALLERPESNFEWDGTCGCGAGPHCKHEIALPYGVSFQKFLRKSGFVVEPGMVEVAVYSAIYRCAGKFDMYGHRGRTRILVDLKSGKPQPAVAIQLSAYRFMLRESRGVETDESYALWLDPEGGFPKVVQPEQPSSDERIFQSLIECWWWKKTHGILPRKD
jgi:hypothetical protein